MKSHLHSQGEKPRALAKKVGDAVLFVLFAVIVYLFIQHNGFIGHSDIQPYPY